MAKLNLECAIRDEEGVVVKYGKPPGPKKEDERPDYTVRKVVLLGLNGGVDRTTLSLTEHNAQDEPFSEPKGVTLQDEEDRADLIFKLRSNRCEFSDDEINMMKRFVLIGAPFIRAQCLRVLKGYDDPFIYDEKDVNNFDDEV